MIEQFIINVEGKVNNMMQKYPIPGNESKFKNKTSCQENNFL